MKLSPVHLEIDCAIVVHVVHPKRTAIIEFEKVKVFFIT